LPSKLTTGPVIFNRQRRVRVSPGRFGAFLARARCALGLSRESFVVCFVSDVDMTRWNRAYRSKPGPTDVLCFPAEEEHRNGRKKSGGPGRAPSPAGRAAGESYLGDIAIAPAVARRNAKKFGRTLEDEIRILMLHGMLHLLGYDHETDTGQMNRREQRLRRALGLA
jgi:probable rRNA maturation factor